MGTIGIIIQMAAVLVVVVAGLGIMAFPVLVEVDIKNKLGKGFLNPWMTGIELICLIGCMDSSSDSFYGNLGCMFLAVVLSAVLARKKAKKLCLGKRMAIGAVFAQILSPVCLLFIVFMLGRLVGNLKNDKK